MFSATSSRTRLLSSAVDADARACTRTHAEARGRTNGRNNKSTEPENRSSAVRLARTSGFLELLHLLPLEASYGFDVLLLLLEPNNRSHDNTTGERRARGKKETTKENAARKNTKHSGIPLTPDIACTLKHSALLGRRHQFLGESGVLLTSTQHNTTQHSTTQHSTAQHNTTQHNTAQHNTAQHNTAQHSTAQHNTTQHNTAQHTRRVSESPQRQRRTGEERVRCERAKEIRSVHLI